MQVKGTEWKFGLMFLKYIEKKRREKRKEKKEKEKVSSSTKKNSTKKEGIFLSLLPSKLILSLFWISRFSELKTKDLETELRIFEN